MDEPFLRKIIIADQAASGSSSTPRSSRIPALRRLSFTAFVSPHSFNRSSTLSRRYTSDNQLILPLPSFRNQLPESEYHGQQISKSDSKSLHRRSNSAPSIFTEDKEQYNKESLFPRKRKSFRFSREIVALTLIGLIVYIIIVVLVFVFSRDDFDGTETIAPIDALYFTVVTLCTIGYGDIVPDSTFTKLFTCVFILVGFGFIDILLNGLVNYALDRQEDFLLGPKDENQFRAMVRTYIIDKKKGRMRIRTKVCLALGVVIGCLAIGTVAAHLIEGYSWVDSFYLSVTSVTTVGYGDYNFKTTAGRCFAVIWLLVSTLAVARAFLYLTEFRIDKRNRVMAEETLVKKITPGDFIAADMDNDGSISKAEYVIYKLREMERITEEEITRICDQFDGLENKYTGKLIFGSFTRV